MNQPIETILKIKSLQALDKLILIYFNEFPNGTLNGFIIDVFGEEKKTSIVNEKTVNSIKMLLDLEILLIEKTSNLENTPFSELMFTLSLQGLNSNWINTTTYDESNSISSETMNTLKNGLPSINNTSIINTTKRGPCINISNNKTLEKQDNKIESLQDKKILLETSFTTLPKMGSLKSNSKRPTKGKNLIRALTIKIESNKKDKARELVSELRIFLINRGLTINRKWEFKNLQPAIRLVNRVGSSKVKRGLTWFLENDFWRDKIESFMMIEKHFNKFELTECKTSRAPRTLGKGKEII